MDEFLQSLANEWPDTPGLLKVSFRLLLAAVCGAVPGFQRETLRVPAGLRTHMLVSLGAAIFMLASLDSGASIEATTRVIQGLATGIGFVGAGAIMKAAEGRQVHGLTTAASIWLAAGLGTAAGIGRIWLPLLGSAMTFMILGYLRRLENHVNDPVDPA